MVGAAQLRRPRDGAQLVNAARVSLIDQEALNPRAGQRANPGRPGRDHSGAAAGRQPVARCPTSSSRRTSPSGPLRPHPVSAWPPAHALEVFCRVAGERSRHPRPLGAVWHQPVAQASASWYVREERCLTPVRYGTGRRGHPVLPTAPRGGLSPTTRSGHRRAPNAPETNERQILKQPLDTSGSRQGITSCILHAPSRWLWQIRTTNVRDRVPKRVGTTSVNKVCRRLLGMRITNAL